MDSIHTRANRWKKAIIVDNILYRQKNILKNGDIVYVCSAGKNCNMSITTDRDGLAIVNTKNSHTCNSDASAQKAVRVRKQSGDISRRPASIIRTELQGMDENSLQPKDIYNASLSLYRERRKNIPTLPKTILETMDALEQYDTINSKKENMLLVNDRDSEIMIISTYIEISIQ
jgi:hypothetical protein